MTETMNIGLLDTSRRGLREAHQFRRLSYSWEEWEATSTPFIIGNDYVAPMDTDYSTLVLFHALKELDRAGSYSAVKSARSRLLQLAPIVSPAVMRQIRSVHTTEREAIFEDLLVAGLEPNEALKLASGSTHPIEASAWVGVLASYMNGDTVDPQLKNAMLLALLDKLGHRSVSVRIATVNALGRIADDFPAAIDELQQVADHDRDDRVRSEAIGALADNGR